MTFGARFVKWGLGLFLFSVFLTFGIVAHYCVGARWPTSDLFMQNITLWWACPWTLSVAEVQAGGLGMVALGLAHMVGARFSPTGARNSSALWLCVGRLLGVFAVGYPGYVLFDAISPGYYCSPVTIGKNTWLLGQGLVVAIFLGGATLMFIAVQRSLDGIPSQPS